MKKPFYLVWNPQGGAPTYQHPSYQDAQVEAKRLARANPDQTFFVLESISGHMKIDVQSFSMNPHVAQPKFGQDIDYTEIPF